MNYKDLNSIQKKNFNKNIKSNYRMEWENPDFLDLLLGCIPFINITNDDEINNYIYKINGILKTYDSFNSNKDTLLKELKTLLFEIRKKNKYWHGLDINEIEMYFRIHEFCLISGEGGIGKSYFINCFEEELTKRNIEHLCIYGKYEKDTSNINVQEIIDASKNGFVFIVDALNEMSETGQINLLKILEKLKKSKKIRIIVTYRTNSMENEILQKYGEISCYDYRFPGVSFESALGEILKTSAPDVYLYEDILYSNNALLLNALCSILSSEKLVDEQENGISSITYILEQYIKLTINGAFKRTIACDGRDIWEDTKKVAKWMYRHNKKRIDEISLFSIIKNGDSFISYMKIIGFMHIYSEGGTNYYYFTIDSLTDFLIVRCLFDELKDKDYDEQVKLINDKKISLYGIEEALIITLFDRMSPDYEHIKMLLIDTGLSDYFDYRTLVKIHFKNNDIKKFRECFCFKETENEMLRIIGGFTNKPYNSKNFLYHYYCRDKNGVIKLSNNLAGYHFHTEIKNRLKNVLYFTTLNNRDDRRDDEALYFSLICCGSPNQEIRRVAIKLLYEVCLKNDDYIEKIINEYNNIYDLYIQEAIIFVLSNIKKKKERIDVFFKLVIKQRNVTAKSIKRIALYFDKPYSYIEWNRPDLYSLKQDAEISNSLDSMLREVDFQNKDFLPFRYWSKNNITIFTRFLETSKQQIKNINSYLNNKYECVRNGKCNGWMGFEDVILHEFPSSTEIKTLDDKSFLMSFENVLRDVFSIYRLDFDDNQINLREEDFKNSIYMKCVDIATGIYYGSLMCNHYTNIFSTFNNYQDSIGYEVYDPLEMGEDINIATPIQTYQENIERLSDSLVNCIEQPLEKDNRWAFDLDMVKSNILRLIKTIKFRKQEWVLLAGRVSLQEKEHNFIKNDETYDIFCCTSKNETICNDYRARYLTIELESYTEDLNYYKENTNKPWLCKKVNNICTQSDVFDETSLVLPPSEIIDFFDLKINISDLSWETKNKEKVILCNNNKNSYYINQTSGTVFIRKDYFDKYVNTNFIKYFVFSSKSVIVDWRAKGISYHFEICDDLITKEINNYTDAKNEHNIENKIDKKCSTCSIQASIKRLKAF